MFEVVLLGTFHGATFILLLLVNLIWTIEPFFPKFQLLKNTSEDVMSFFLAFKNDLPNVLQHARKEDTAEEAMHLAKAASIARKEHKKYKFDRSFEVNC